MKKIFTLILIVHSAFCILNSALAQTPQSIPYQAVARDNAGNLIANQNISLRFSIHDATAGGTVIYQETHSATTNTLGLFIVNVGEGTVVTGTFAGINWASNAKFMQVEMDAAGGTSYTDMGTQQMLSVPYALNSATSSDNKWTSAGSNINNNNTGNVGIGTASPEFKLSLDNDGGILAKGTYGSGALLSTSGLGSRLIWYPRKSAFRAGYAGNNEWDDNNTGIGSAAFGAYTRALGQYAFATGYGTDATGYISTTFGQSTTASGQSSMATGYATISSGESSMAAGNSTRAPSFAETALGTFNTIYTPSSTNAKMALHPHCKCGRENRGLLGVVCEDTGQRRVRTNGGGGG